VTSAVRCEHVSKSYSRVLALGIKEWIVGRRRASGRFTREWALKDVSFDVQPGEGFGIVGPNGSGKSTLLAVLLGVLRPEAGSVQTCDRVASLLELGAGFHPELTGRQNTYLYGTILGLRLREIRRRFEQIAAFSELGEAIDEPLRTYSSGMMARLGFAVISQAEADLLLVDEVLAVGDLEFQRKCRAYLQAFKNRGGTLVLVSHDLKSLEDLCERGLYLDQGHVRMAGGMHDVARAYAAPSHGVQKVG
jgi:lipopolysaccharide transport system ATP-binding protein